MSFITAYPSGEMKRFGDFKNAVNIHSKRGRRLLFVQDAVGARLKKKSRNERMELPNLHVYESLLLLLLFLFFLFFFFCLRVCNFVGIG